MRIVVGHAACTGVMNNFVCTMYVVYDCIGRKRVTRKEPLPKKGEEPLHGLKTDKNFITANALEAILAEPQNVRQEPVRGTDRPDYAHIPAYLVNLKKDIAEEREYVAHAMQVQAEREAEAQAIAANESTRVMTEEERVTMLAGLKQRYDEVYQEYQVMPLVCSTQAQCLRREAKESELDTLERNIERLSRQFVFVQD